MKQKQTVKKRLAILMSAVLLASSLPLTSLAVVNLGGGEHDTWRVQGITMKAESDSAQVGEEVTVTITGSAETRPSTASNAWSSPGDCVTASNAMKDLVKNLEVSLDGKAVGKDVVTVSELTDWNGETGTFTVTSTVAGTVTLKLNGDDADPCTIKFVEQTAEDGPSITGIRNVYDTEGFYLGIGSESTVAVEPEIEGTATPEQLSELYQEFKNGLTVTIENPEIATVEIDKQENSERPVYITVKAVAKGETSLKVSYGNVNSLELSINVEGDVIVFTDCNLNNTTISESYNKVLAESSLSDEQKKNIRPQYTEILEAVSKSIDGSEISEDDDIMTLLYTKFAKEVKDGYTVKLKTSVAISDLAMKLDGEKLIVTGMDVDLSVDVEVNDKKYPLSTLFDEPKLIRMQVPVPAPDARGGEAYKYAKWTHYDDAERTKENNGVINDLVTEILEPNYEYPEGMAEYVAYVESTSFSPFTLEFVMEDNKKDDDNTGGSSSSGSSSSDNGSSDSSSSSGTSKPASTEKPASAPTPLTGNWEQDETGWWFSETDGTYPASEWAWIEYEGQCYWYHFNAAGYMDTDWFCDLDGKWYYLNPISDGWKGRMLTGWAYLSWEDQDSWYYFNADGSMATGWVKDGELQYYLHPVSDGTRGHMYTGWQQIEGTWYYFSEVSDGTKGHLLTGTTTPDGNTVDASGAWVQ